MQIKRLLRKKENLFFLFMIFLINIPYLLSIPYSTLCADDFSMTMHPFSIINCFRESINFYYSWGGNVPIIFLEYLLNPLQYCASYSFLPGIILLFLFVFNEFTTYLFFRHIFIDLFSIKNTLAIKLGFVIYVFTLLNTAIYTEVFYWYTGGVGSLLSLSITQICIIGIIKYFKSKTNIWKCIGLSALGFITCFSYRYAVSIGLVYLIVWSLEIIMKKQKKTWYHIIPMFFMLTGGIIAVIAPGNYARHEIIDSSGLHIWDSILFTTQNISLCLSGLLGRPLFILYLLGMLIIGLYSGLSKLRINPLMLWLMSFVGVFGIVFPIALGYSSDSLPNRQFFVIFLTMLLWFGFSAIATGAGIKQIIEKYSIPKWCFIITYIVLLVFSPLIRTGEKEQNYIFQLPSARIVENLAKIKKQNEFNRKILKDIEESEGNTVVISVSAGKIPEETGIISDIGLVEDPTYWINKALGKWYEKESISLIVE